MQDFLPGKPPFFGASRLSLAMAALLSTAFLCLPACEKPSYPISYTFVEPNTGKPLEVEITGRTQTHVEFIRLKDSKFFSYPIDKLTADDKKFVSQPKLEKTDPSRKVPAYIRTRLDHITRLGREIARLGLGIKNESDNPGLLKFHQRQIGAKEAEVLELQTQIEAHKLDH